MNHYETLGLSAAVDEVVIKAAYRALCQRYHPDKCRPGERDRAHRRMAEINAAFQSLGDPVSRQQYDEGLARGSTGKEPTASSMSGGAGMPSRHHARPWGGRVAILSVSALLALAMGVDKKPWWQWSWELLTSGFDSPPRYLLHWPVILVTLVIGLWLASRVGRRPG